MIHQASETRQGGDKWGGLSHDFTRTQARTQARKQTRTHTRTHTRTALERHFYSGVDRSGQQGWRTASSGLQPPPGQDSDNISRGIDDGGGGSDGDGDRDNVEYAKREEEL